MAQAGRHRSPAAQEKTCCDIAQPSIEANRLHALPDCYKIKLRSSGYRLVYQVLDDEVVVFVVAVDRREREQVYRKADDRLK
jgi:mRNA interferase RelE/StbE